MSDLKEVELRPAKPTDMALIFDTWMEDFLSGHHVRLKGEKMMTRQTHIAMMNKELYYKEQRALINKILAKSKVLVACNAEDEDQIFGYVVHRVIGLELGLVSWCYVRPVFRGMGISNKLMENIGSMDVVTHLTPQRRWFPKKYGLIYNPYMEGYDD